MLIRSDNAYYLHTHTHIYIINDIYQRIIISYNLKLLYLIILFLLKLNDNYLNNWNNNDI